MYLKEMQKIELIFFFPLFEVLVLFFWFGI